MSDRDDFDALLGGLDRPVPPRPAFARELREQLLAELAHEFASTGEPTTMHALPPLRAPLPAGPAGERARGKHPFMIAFEIAAALLLLIGIWQFADRLLGSPNVNPGGQNLAALSATAAAPTATVPVAPAATAVIALISTPATANNGETAMSGGDPGRNGAQAGPAPEGKLSAQDIPLNGEVKYDSFAPVALGDTLYRVSSGQSTTAGGGTKTDPHLEARDITTGALKWSVAVRVWGSPAVADGTVFVWVQGAGNVSSGLEAYSAIDGGFLWRTPVTFINGCCTGMFVSPIVADGVVYTAGVDGKAYAVDAKTGAVIWTSTAAQSQLTISEAMANGVTMYYAGQTAVGDGFLYVANADAEIVALNLKDGSLAWKVNLSTAYGFALRQVQPFYADGTLLLTAQATQTDDQMSAKVNDMIALDPTTGAAKWDAKLQDGATVSSMAAGGNIALISYNLTSGGANDVEAYDIATGAMVWHYASSDDHAANAGLVVVGDNAYFTGNGGKLFKANVKTGDVSVIYQDDAAAGQAVYAPVVSDGVIVLDHGVASGNLVILSASS